MRDSPGLGGTLLALYDRALPQVYSYVRNRVHQRSIAEDLTAETFLAAVAQINRRQVNDVTIAWLIGIARHKLLDHWRREIRQPTASIGDDADAHDAAVEDPWDAVIDAARVSDVLQRLGPHHRGALTLRYLDGFSVPEVAAQLDSSVHATEALLVRARHAFRVTYEGSEHS